jgi:hypothetical protein
MVLRLDSIRRAVKTENKLAIVLDKSKERGAGIISGFLSLLKEGYSDSRNHSVDEYLFLPR